MAQHIPCRYGGINFGVRSTSRKLKTTIPKEGPAPGAYTLGSSRMMESSTKMRKAPTTLIGTAVRKMNPTDNITVRYVDWQLSDNSLLFFSFSEIPTGCFPSFFTHHPSCTGVWHHHQCSSRVDNKSRLCQFMLTCATSMIRRIFLRWCRAPTPT